MARTLGRKELEGRDGERKSVREYAPTNNENLTTTAPLTVSIMKLSYLVPSLPPLVPKLMFFLSMASWFLTTAWKTRHTETAMLPM